MLDQQWLTPSADTTDTTCRQISVPDNAGFRRAFWGALLLLTEAQNWEQLDGIAPDVAAARMWEMVDPALQATDCPDAGGGDVEHGQVQDVKENGTHGGTFTSGANRQRDLTEVTIAQSWLSLSDHEITLTDGEYRILVRAPANRVGYHRLYLADSGGVFAFGENAQANNSNTVQTHAFLSADIVVSGSATFWVEHLCQTTVATYGFGYRLNESDEEEFYTTVDIWKIA